MIVLCRKCSGGERYFLCNSKKKRRQKQEEREAEKAVGETGAARLDECPY